MPQIVPFVCRECGAKFPELEGFICSICRRLLCQLHLSWRSGSPVCWTCAKIPRD